MANFISSGQNVKYFRHLKYCLKVFIAISE